MKDRINNPRTTLMGVAIFVLALALLIIGKLTVLEFITLTVLSWVFIAAKDSLLEGITAGIFKLANPTGPEKIDQGAEAVKQGVDQIKEGIQEVNKTVQDAKATPQP
jgi:hypothetical protein